MSMLRTLLKPVRRALGTDWIIRTLEAQRGRAEHAEAAAASAAASAQQVADLARRTLDSLAARSGAAPSEPAPEPASGNDGPARAFVRGNIGELSRRDFPVLPGSRWAEYLLPYDYTPSRDYRPRWGASRPPIPSIGRLFAAHHPAYERILAQMHADAGRYERIPRQFTLENLPTPGWVGGAMCAFDQAALYTLMGSLRPRTYLEIGSGISTCFARRAVTDHRLQTKIISIDPAPRAAIDGICDHVIRDGLETCDLAIFDDLQPNDVVYMDGSHRTFMNSDVTVFMIDVLPRLKPGVIVHIHDITVPYDYPDMFAPWYWNEQYMVAVYLMQAAARITPIFPTAYVTRCGAFNAWFEKPPLDLGPDNPSWRGGGSLWFTHNTPFP